MVLLMNNEFLYLALSGFVCTRLQHLRGSGGDSLVNPVLSSVGEGSWIYLNIVSLLNLTFAGVRTFCLQTKLTPTTFLNNVVVQRS